MRGKQAAPANALGKSERKVRLLNLRFSESGDTGSPKKVEESRSSALLPFGNTQG
jgi:hypothetical protein